MPVVYIVFILLSVSCTSQIEKSQIVEIESAEGETTTPRVGLGNYCIGPNNLIVQEGSEVIVYKKNSVSCGSTCSSISGKVRCKNGQLTGDVAYTEHTCVSQPCRCKYGNLLINVGQKVKFYKKNRGSCEDASLACDHSSNVSDVECLPSGFIKGPPANDYPHRSCVTPTCFCNLPNGVKIPRGSSRTLFKQENPGCQGNCYATGNFTRINCGQDGVLTGDFDIGKFASCQVPNCDCELTSGVKVVFGRELIVYSNSKAACGQKCEDFSGKVSCLTKNTPTAAPAEAVNYMYSSCLQEACEGQGGGNGGGTGNSYGPGQGWFDDEGGSGDGGPGAPTSLVIISKSFCSTPWNAAKDNIRNQSGALKGRVSDGASFVAFDTPTVNCGDRCTNHSLVRVCTNGVLSGSDNFKFKKCESICPVQ